MPERIASNLSAIGKLRDEIELALVFWFIGATIGIGQSIGLPARADYRFLR